MKRVLFRALGLAALVLLLLTAVSAREPDSVVLREQAELIQEGAFPDFSDPSGASLMNASDSLAEILDAGLHRRDPVIDLSSQGLKNTQQDRKLVRLAFEDAVNSSPDLFYVTGNYELSVQDGALVSLTPFYNAELLPKADALEAAVQEALACIHEGMTPLEKVIALHDYVTLHVHYNWEVRFDQQPPNSEVYSAYGALVNHDAVCAGYAEAYALLLQRAGIPTEFCSGPNHIWNMVQLDGQWYHIDTTWDDNTNEGSSDYTHFLLSDDALIRRDPPKADQTGSNHYPMERPAAITCTDTRYEAPEWLFRRVENHLYHFENRWYGLAGRFSDLQLIQAADLTDAGTATTIVNRFSAYYASSVFWYQDRLFLMTTRSNQTDPAAGDTVYVDLLNLHTGAICPAAELSFQPAPSADGIVAAESDNPSMTREGNTLKLWSYTRPGTCIDQCPLPPASSAPTIFYEDCFQASSLPPVSLKPGEQAVITAPAPWPNHRFIGWFAGQQPWYPGDPITLGSDDLHLQAMYAVEDGLDTGLLLPKSMLTSWQFSYEDAFLSVHASFYPEVLQELQETPLQGVLLRFGCVPSTPAWEQVWFYDADTCLGVYSVGLYAFDKQTGTKKPLILSPEAKYYLDIPLLYYHPARGTFNQYFSENGSMMLYLDHKASQAADGSYTASFFCDGAPREFMVKARGGPCTIAEMEQNRLSLFLNQTESATGILAVYENGRMVDCRTKTLVPHAGLWTMDHLRLPQGCTLQLYLLDPVTHAPLREPYTPQLVTPPAA